MSWLRLDDGFTHHPKFNGWRLSQRWAFLEIMEYCARYDTCGKIPKDLSLLPKTSTETLLKLAEKSGWIDLDSDGNRVIHDFLKYNPKDPGKAARQARWRANRRHPVDDHVDANVDEEKRLHEASLARGTRPRTVPSTTEEEHSSSSSVDDDALGLEGRAPSDNGLEPDPQGMRHVAQIMRDALAKAHAEKEQP